jgi:glycosyltransferase involved in cell wall biosynthesis
MKFTCVIGTYNPNPSWLDRAVNSAMGLFDEIVIVDDGSTNDCVPVAWISTNVAQQIKKIKHDTNKGFYEAKNTAIRNSTGDIIASLDDDDYFNAAGVVELKEFIEEHDSDVWHFILRQFNESTDLYGQGANPEGLYSHSAIPSQSWFKRSMWEELGGYTYPLAEDWDFWLRAYKRGKRFTYFPRIVYNYNRRSDSLSAQWTGQKFDKIYREVMERNK